VAAGPPIPYNFKSAGKPATRMRKDDDLVELAETKKDLPHFWRPFIYTKEAVHS